MSGVEPQLRLDATVRRFDGPGGSSVLLGGSPLRVLRLQPAAKLIIDSLAIGGTVQEVLDGVPEARHASSRRFIDALVRRGLVHPLAVPDPLRPLHDVTLVVPVHDRATSLARLLHSLAPLGDRGLSVVVVDDVNGSDRVADAYSAKYLMQAGAFNLNSVSKAAWMAVVASSVRPSASRHSARY